MHIYIIYLQTLVHISVYMFHKSLEAYC